MKQLQPGDVLDGRYTVVENLAQGGFGQTFVAEDRRRPGNPRCVVKQLKPESNHPGLLETAKRLFFTEAETLERLGNHTQVPRLLAYFQEDEEFYLVQELITGQPLTRELQPGQPWSEQKIVQMLQSVLQVLAFIHQNGVIHRDIKPDNIIRRYTDQALVLVDFGTVKQLRHQLISQVTAQGQVAHTVAIGTPGYMPTEQSRGNPRHNSDIYALGMVAIQAATGLTLSQLQEDQATGELIWEPWSKVSAGLSAILSNMVRYHFKERYQSAMEVLQAMQAAGAIAESTLPQVTPSPSGAGRSGPSVTEVSGPGAAAVSSSQPTELQPGGAFVQPQSGDRAQPGVNRLQSGPTGQGTALPPTPPPAAPANNYNSAQETVVAAPGGSGALPLSQTGGPQPVNTVGGVAGGVTRSQPVTGPRGPQVIEAAPRTQGGWLDSLKLAAVFGSGSWLLAIALITFLSAVWQITGLWLLGVALAVFGLFAKGRELPQKFVWLAVAVITTGIALMLSPQSLPLNSLFAVGPIGWLTVAIAAVLAGSLAFILLMLAETMTA